MKYICGFILVIVLFAGVYRAGHMDGFGAGMNHGLVVVQRAIDIQRTFDLTEAEMTSPAFKKVLLIKDDDEFERMAFVWLALKEVIQ